MDRNNRKEFIKIWRPRDVVDQNDHENTDPLITILEESDRFFVDSEFALSHDNSMIAICAKERNDRKVMHYSIDSSNKSTALKQSFSAWYNQFDSHRTITISHTTTKMDQHLGI